MTWVLLPGFDGTGKLFAPLLHALPSEIEAVVVSYPIDRRCTADELVEIAGAKFPKSGPFVVIAESFSGPIGLRAASLHSLPPMAVVLCASFVRPPFHPMLMETFKAAATLLARSRPPQWLVRRYLLGYANPELIKLFRSAIGDVHRNVLVNRLSAFAEFTDDFTPPQLPAPLLYLQAEQDRLVSPRSFEAVKRKYPQVILRKINAPHLLLQTQPVAAMRAISEILLPN